MVGHDAGEASDGGRDGTVARPDAGDSGAANDGGVPPGCEIAVTCSSGCPMPWLLVGVEDLPGDQNCGGLVLRYALTGTDSLCSCAPLRGGGDAPALVRTVGAYPPDTVVVANEAETVAIDAASDTVVWREPTMAGLPRDVFALRNAAGAARVAVAREGTSGGDLRFVESFDARTGENRLTWTLNDGSFPLGLSVASMTQSPFEPTRFFALRSDMYASAEVDPITRVRLDPPHTRSRVDYWLKTVWALYHTPFFHTVWTGEAVGTSSVFNLQHGDVSSDHGVPLGSRCSNFTCEYLHGVPDPTLNTGMFALCQAADERRVVRFRSTRTECSEVVLTSALPVSSRITRLGVLADSFWP